MEVLLNQGKTSKEDRGKQIQKRRKEPKVHPEGAPRSSSGESAQKSSYDVNEGINIVGEKTYQNDPLEVLEDEYLGNRAGNEEISSSKYQNESDDDSSNRSRSRDRNRSDKSDNSDQYDEEPSTERDKRLKLHRPPRRARSNRQPISASEARMADTAECFVIFFGQVGHPKGFVFNQGERRKLQKESIKRKKTNQFTTNWDESATWNETIQKEKIAVQLQPLMATLTEEQLGRLTEIMLIASSLCSSECTQDIYRFICQIWKINKMTVNETTERENALREFVQTIRNDNSKNYPYLNFHFSKYFKLPNELQSEHAYSGLVRRLSEILAR